MLYTMEYRLKKSSEDDWSWYVQGKVIDMSGKAVCWSAMTAKCNKNDAEHMYYETFEKFNII